MPIDYANYPDNWKEIRAAILARAQHRCEFCGIDNYAIGYRTPDGTFYEACDEYVDSGKGKPYKQIRIVLTIAHLDHDTTNNDEGNLRALCQRCHLRYDAHYHAKNAAETLRRKREELCRNG